MDFLLKKLGGDSQRFVNLANEEGWTPLHLACFMNNFDMVNLLKENGANFVLQNSAEMTPLHELVRCDNKDLFECVYEDAKLYKRNVK
jgi:ankyrin repeat protein